MSYIKEDFTKCDKCGSTQFYTKRSIKFHYHTGKKGHFNFFKEEKVITKDKTIYCSKCKKGFKDILI